MARTQRSDEKIRKMEKRIKQLKIENEELKKQIVKLQPKNVGYKKPDMKEHYSTTKVKKAIKSNPNEK